MAVCHMGFTRGKSPGAPSSTHGLIVRQGGVRSSEHLLFAAVQHPEPTNSGPRVSQKRKGMAFSHANSVATANRIPSGDPRSLSAWGLDEGPPRHNPIRLIPPSRQTRKRRQAQSRSLPHTHRRFSSSYLSSSYLVRRGRCARSRGHRHRNWHRRRNRRIGRVRPRQRQGIDASRRIRAAPTRA
jgi:hypothetical protein